MGLIGVSVISCIMLLSLEVFAFDEQIMQFYPLGDQFLIVGSELRVNCSLNKNRTEFDMDQVYIQKGKENITQEYLNTYEAESTLEMVISNVSLDDFGFYSCFYGDGFQSLTKISVAERPGWPVNISCLTYEMLDMRCSFSLPESSSIPIEWHMEYQLKGETKYTVNCSIETEYEVKCADVPNNMLIQLRTYEVFVQGVNEKYNVNISKSFEVHYNFSIVKFGPVQDLSVVMGTRLAQIQWKRPKQAFYFNSIAFEYKVIVTSENNWQDVVTKYVRDSYKKEESITIHDLIPYSNYSISVRNKVVDAVGDMYWSSASRLENEATLPDVPTYSVNMTSGSYAYVDYGEYMNAVLYWTNPDEREWCGQIVGYEVIVQNDSSLMVLSPSKKHGGDAMSFPQPGSTVIYVKEGLSEVLQLNTPLIKSHRYTLTVSLLNKEGKSENASQITIPDWDKGQQMQPSWVSVELLSSGQRISWEIDDELCGQIMYVTVYWCRDQPAGASYIHCKENFDWHTFEVTDGCKDNVKEITTNSLGSEDFKYGVSIATAELSGGIHWENFRFKNLKDGKKFEKTVL